MDQTITNPVKVIRKYCLECCRASPNEVALCPAEDCWLHPFRMGNNPYRAKRELSEEQKEAQRQRGREAMARLQATRKSTS